MRCAMLSGMATHTNPELIGSGEVCRLLNVNQATVSRWVKAEVLAPVHQFPGKNGAYLFSRADVEQLAADREKASA